jgi:hypothetical protein
LPGSGVITGPRLHLLKSYTRLIIDLTVSRRAVTAIEQGHDDQEKYYATLGGRIEENEE